MTTKASETTAGIQPADDEFDQSTGITKRRVVEAIVDAAKEFTSGPAPEIHAYPIAAERIDADAMRVIRRLRESGYAAYLVGGGVRDLLLGRLPKDFDVATSARPEEVRRLFRNCRVIGRRFRLAHILYGGGKIIEVATFRRDPSEALEVAEGEFEEEMQAAAEGDAFNELTPPPGTETFSDVTPPPRVKHRDTPDLLIRHDNVFGEPHEDAIRRDFTINGLFYDVDGERVIDFVGGVRDLEKRVVRTIGDPVVRFREDPVRMLRAIKFSARCELGIEPDVYDALVAEREELRKSAAPRLLEEILRLLRGGAARRSLYLAWDTGMLSVLLPELSAYLDDHAPDYENFWSRLDVIDEYTKENGALPDAVLMLALLWGPLSEMCEGERDVSRAFERFWFPITKRLSVPRRMRDRMRMMFIVQPKLAQGRYAQYARRDFFADASSFYGLACESRGEDPPEWVERESGRAPQGGAPSREGSPRRRRRRRR